MHSKDIGVNDAVERVLIDLTAEFQRRIKLVATSRDQLTVKHQGDGQRVMMIRLEAQATIDALNWSIEHIDREVYQRRAEADRRRTSTITGHTDTVDLP